MIVGELATQYPLVVYDESSFSFGAVAVYPDIVSTGPLIVLGGGAAMIQFGNGTNNPDTYLTRTAEGKFEFSSQGSGAMLILQVRPSGPTPPAAGQLALYAIEDSAGHPQIRVKNSDNSTRDLTNFTDGS
jgi:hypothetical protein